MNKKLKPTLGDMPSYGRVSDKDMLAAVSEALTGRRDISLPEAMNPETNLGHEIVPRINFNSLNRIITAFCTPNPAANVGAVKALEWAEENGRLRARLGDREYMLNKTSDGVTWSGSTRVYSGHNLTWGYVPNCSHVTLEQAKAAAQSDLQTRIDALTSPQGEETPAAPSTQADVRGDLYDPDAFMADGEVPMTAAENVLAWLLIEKIGVPDDVGYSPNQAQEIILRRLDLARELEEIDAMLAEGQGDDEGYPIMPEFTKGMTTYAKVEACLHLLERRRDALHPDPIEACERCQGNGEIVTDWERYRHPHEGDVGDEAVAECPDCNGEGEASPAPQPRETPTLKAPDRDGGGE
jgi:hypothetical protein